MRSTYHLYLDGVQLPIPDRPESVVLDDGRALRAAGVNGKLEYRCAQLNPAGEPYPFWPIPKSPSAESLRPRGELLIAQFGITLTRRVAPNVKRRSLRSYFEDPVLQVNALGAVAKEKWLDPAGNLDLYEASRIAFDPTSNSDEAFRQFEKIYNTLAGPDWQVFRSGKPAAARWSAEQVFETIKEQFGEFAWSGSINLLSLESKTLSRLESGFEKMVGIKEKIGYPHMTVSKFLHFYNPALFPIYDGAVIFDKVFTRFRSDFRDFCEAAGIPYKTAINDDSAAFLVYYMRWANHLLASAHPTFMMAFVNWLEKQPGAELERRGFDAATLYATAFEFTVIGATAT